MISRCKSSFNKIKKCLAVVWSSLFGRLKLLAVIWVVAAVGSISYTLILAWHLEGVGAAINDAGSLRMRTYRTAFLAAQSAPAADIKAQIDLFEQTLDNLKNGDESRPLFLPDDKMVNQQVDDIDTVWQQEIKPLLQSVDFDSNSVETVKQRIKTFVQRIDRLVQTVEDVNVSNIYYLRFFQMMLLAMVLVGVMVMMVLLYWWIVRPLNQLQQAVMAVSDGNLDAEVPIDSLTEFAEVGHGFNQMGQKLQHMYKTLEIQVQQKTQDLKQRNHELNALYQASNTLYQAHTTLEVSNQFLAQILPISKADAGSIRLLDFKRQRMDLVTSIGLPDSIQTAEQCEQFDACLCGQVAPNLSEQAILFVDDWQQLSVPKLCQRSGFAEVRVFPIVHKDVEIGILSLYFRQSKQPQTGFQQLMQSLCQQLGVTIANLRLVEESKQLAVLQERSLLAQSLHDSIAQTLTFLNLQIQMLETALQQQEQQQVAENLQLIKAGVQECYEDVRELLLNFRTKITNKQLPEAVYMLTKRFEAQTNITANISWKGDGLPLTSLEQLQVVFIMQESLSNIRKHAEAENVWIEFINEDDFVVRIRDDGVGFNIDDTIQRLGEHIGLGIMKERAQRIQAKLCIDSKLGHGTTVTLIIAHRQRKAS